MTTKPPCIFLSVCEPSGDALGAALIKALKASSELELDFIGIGGPLMAAEGFQSLFPIDELALMGLAEVVPKIPHVMARLSEVEALVRVARPDVVVTIDSPGFNTRLAKRVTGLGFPVIQYVAPQVWAWRANRVFGLSEIFDEILCLLPFEPAFFEDAGLKATFVGHSVVSSGLQNGDAAAFRAAHQIAADDPILMCLPGSRRSEIEKLTPIFGEALEDIWREVPNLKVVIPTLENKRALVDDLTRSWPIRPTVILDPTQKRHAFAAARAAMAASGTVALELAMAAVPMVVAYKVNKLSAEIAKRLLRVPYVNLINLLLDRPVVPELIQDGLSAEQLSHAVIPLLTDQAAHEAQKLGLEEAMALLGKDRWQPADRAAEAILQYVRK